MIMFTDVRFMYFNKLYLFKKCFIDLKLVNELESAGNYVLTNYNGIHFK